jgi:two-component system phosphate regulon response regulator PhoB
VISSRVASLQEHYLATRPTKHFLENPEKVFSRGQLLDAVWHHNENIEVRTVDVHIRR